MADAVWQHLVIQANKGADVVTATRSYRHCSTRNHSETQSSTIPETTSLLRRHDTTLTDQTSTLPPHPSQTRIQPAPRSPSQTTPKHPPQHPRTMPRQSLLHLVSQEVISIYFPNPGSDPASQTTSPARSPALSNGPYGAGTNSPLLGSNPPSNPYAPSPYSLNGAIASTSIIAQNAQKDPNAPPPLPSLPLDYSRNEEYGMKESLFTCLKDLFERIIGENGKSGVIAPTKLVEVLKRENGISRH
jgi:hypothetical protein